MTQEKQYINIQQGFTLNTDKDGVADMRKPNEFQILKNLIPSKGELRTREGITLFTHTPAGTTVWTPTSPGQTYPTDPGGGDFAVIQAVFPFNTTASIGTNLLNGAVIYSAQGDLNTGGSGHIYINTTTKQEGAASLWMDDNIVRNPDGDGRIWSMRTVNAFPSWMPGDSGETTNKFLITYWIYPYTAAGTSNAEWHFTFGNDGNTTKIAFGMRHFDNNLQSFWIDSAGGTLANPNFGGVVAENQWQFVAAWYDDDTGFKGLYHYNASTLVETVTASTGPIGNCDHFYHHSTTNTINAKYTWNVAGSANYTDGSDAYHGLIDYCTMWSRPFHVDNSSNITLARLVRDMAWLL